MRVDWYNLFQDIFDKYQFQPKYQHLRADIKYDVIMFIHEEFGIHVKNRIEIEEAIYDKYSINMTPELGDEISEHIFKHRPELLI